MLSKCPCGGKIVPRIRRGKDTGVDICEDCWQNYERGSNPPKPIPNPFKKLQPGLRHPR